MQLQEICELIVDCEHKTAPTQETGFPSIRTPNIGPGYFILDGVKRVSEETYRLWTRRAVPRAGDLIMAREAPVGNVAIIRNGLHPCLGQRTLLIRPNPHAVSPDFLNYFLNGPDVQGRIRSKTNGATVAHLNMEDVRTLDLPTLPPIESQKAIARTLAAYDELIANGDRRIHILEAMARALYREWFVEFRFPGSDAPAVTRRDGEAPRDWSVGTIANVTSFLARGIAPIYDEQGTSLAINQKCIRDQRLSLVPARRQRKVVPAERLIRTHDVLINSTGVGTLGRVAQVLEDIDACTVDTHVTIARPNDTVDPNYFGCALLAREYAFERLGTGATGQTELSRTAIMSVEILLPPHDLQLRFGSVVQPMRTAAVTLAKQIDNLRATRDLLLPRLLSGQLALAETEAAVP